MKKLTTTILFAVLLGTAFLATGPAHAAGGTYVIDGDTIVINGETVRIKGIDTPEKGQPCAAEATMYLKSLLGAAGGKAAIVDRAGNDRYGRTIANVRISGKDVGLLMLKRGYAVARYDGTDGYQPHANQTMYHSATNPISRCAPDIAGEEDPQPAEQDQEDVPFWSFAALTALAADNGLEIDWADIDLDGHNYTDVAAAVWRVAMKRQAEADREARKAEAAREAEAARQAERVRQAERDRQRSTSSSSSSGGSSGYTGCRAYAPGGKTWRPIPCP